MSDGGPKFTCAACGRSYAWTIALASRRAKCKCGEMIAIPSSPPNQPMPKIKPKPVPVSVPEPTREPEPAEDDMYALADVVGMERDAVARAPVKIVDPPPIAAAAVAAPMGPTRGIPLAYQRGPTRQDLRRQSSATVIDPNRDYLVPIGMLLTGIVLSIAYYAIHAGLSPIGIAGAAVGITIVGIIETVFLVIFALVAAGPLGVNFGGIGTAILKLGATAVLCDGILTIFNGVMAKYLGAFGTSILGYACIGLPIAALIYWLCMTYLFSMDPTDSWTVVLILCLVSFVLRWLLVILLLALVFGAMGMRSITVGAPSMSSSGGLASAMPMRPIAYDQINQVNVAMAQHTLVEGRVYVQVRGLKVEAVPVNAWYQAGCPKVWFQMSRDINGHGQAFQMVVQLPQDTQSRLQCYKIAQAYYDGNHQTYLPSDITDNGDPYMMVTLANPE